jgi:AbiV family abortive infection protein
MAKRSKPIAQYGGQLSAQQIADGMNAAARNAKRLLADATVLIEAKRFPTACSLAILSIEESGKLSLLRGFAGVTVDEVLRSRWKAYRDHQAKNAAWIIGELAAKGARTLDDLAPMFAQDSDHSALLDVVKQLGFYTDCYGNAHWSDPQAVLDEKFATMLLTIAQVLLPKHETTKREIELWIEHVAGHWGTPAMRQAAIEFHKAMEQEGLSDHTIEEIEAFYDSAPPKPKRH